MIKLKSILSEANVTPLQNKGMKYFYILLRDTLKDIADKAKEANITPNTFHNFVFKQYPLPPQIKTKGSNYLSLSIPQQLQQIFPELQPTINIRFTVDTFAGMSHSFGKIIDLFVPIPRLLSDFNSIKISLQHETQHLVTKGTDYDEFEENPLLRSLSYYGHPGEIEAHAKQYAYLYFKAFPNDSSLNLKKFMQEIMPKLPDSQKNKLKNYIIFGTNTKYLQDTYKVGNAVISKLKDIHKTFIEDMEYFFQLFKQKTS